MALRRFSSGGDGEGFTDPPVGPIFVTRRCSTRSRDLQLKWKSAAGPPFHGRRPLRYSPRFGMLKVNRVSSGVDATSSLPPWARAISDAI